MAINLDEKNLKDGLLGLVVALAASTLIKAFTDSIVTPLINALAGGGAAPRVSSVQAAALTVCEGVSFSRAFRPDRNLNFC